MQSKTHLHRHHTGDCLKKSRIWHPSPDLLNPRQVRRTLTWEELCFPPANGPNPIVSITFSFPDLQLPLTWWPTSIIVRMSVKVPACNMQSSQSCPFACILQMFFIIVGLQWYCKCLSFFFFFRRFTFFGKIVLSKSKDWGNLFLCPALYNCRWSVMERFNYIPLTCHHPWEVPIVSGYSLFSAQNTQGRKKPHQEMNHEEIKRDRFSRRGSWSRFLNFLPSSARGIGQLLGWGCYAFRISYACLHLQARQRSSEKGSGTGQSFVYTNLWFSFLSSPPPCFLWWPLFNISPSQLDVLRANDGTHTVVGTGEAAIKQTDTSPPHEVF